ncbi:MAG: HIT domain-containing protein [Beijerinckiaceae bacterium]
MSEFTLDSRLEADTKPVLQTPLCDVRLMHDSRWPWLILVPRIVGAVEWHDLAEVNQAALWHETLKAGRILKELTGCDKINTAAIGNIVRQLHVHVIARYEGDTNWPGPVWGFAGKQPYDDGDFPARVRAAWEAAS